MTNNYYKESNYKREDSEKEYSFSHGIDNDGFTMGFHSHNFIEVYYSISGGKHFIINDKIYSLNPGDLFVINANEVHRVIAYEKEIYERIWFEFKPTFVMPYSTPKTDLLHYVYRRGDSFSHKISLDSVKKQKFLSLVNRYEHLTDANYGSDILSRLYYVEMLVFIADTFINAPNAPALELTKGSSLKIIAETLEYISANLSEDINLDSISKNIGLSKYHLCKLFKEKTGTTINKYIVSCRIAKAKHLLSAGKSVTDTCTLSGFNNMSHFVRTFHNTVGTSPGKYAKDYSV